MKSTVNSFQDNPIIAFVLSLLGIGAGTGLHYAHPMLEALPAAVPGALDVTVKIFQCFAYAGGGLAGFIALHGWWVKKQTRKKEK